MRRVPPVLALATCLLLALSCDDEKDNPAGSGDPTPEYAKTPTELITQFFPAVYSQMDSTAYDALLDPAYVFELLKTDPDPSVPSEWWDLHEEMGIAGNMFGGRPNSEGQKVNRINLSMTERANVIDNTAYPDKPDGETWHKVTALVDLLVVVEDPQDNDGVINYVVNSDQIFTVRPDPSHDDGWIVYKQTDQEPINKAGAGEATEESSWGSVKWLFRQTPAYPKTPTELITEYFPAVYTQLDSVGYAAILDEDYRFELLPDDIDPTAPPEWWDLHEEMGIAGNMFNARFNDHGQKVNRINLGMTERANVIDNTPYPDKPDGETWHKVTALVDLLVVVEDPQDNDGVINYVVNSDQIFTVRPDPSHDDGWIVYKQTDREPINKSGSGAGTENSSWGAVKEMFR